MLVKDSVNLPIKRAGLCGGCMFSFFLFPERVQITAISREAETLT